MILFNHQHLYYFWVVAKEGSVTKASQVLYLTQPTLSGQIIQLEKFLGKKLFEREKRKLILTEEGQIAFRYANEIFGTSQEFLEAMRKSPEDQASHLRIGIEAHITKQVALQCLRTAYKRNPTMQITIQEGGLKDLLRHLRDYELDLIFSDQTAPPEDAGNYNVAEIGRLEIFFVAAPKYARAIKKFPEDLAKIPFLLPTPTSPLRNKIERFFIHNKIHPSIVGQFHDTEFMRLLAIEGLGAAPFHELSVTSDLRSGRLVRLGRHSTGITKTLWFIARKRIRENSPAQKLFDNFRIV